jgi:hypothetical protein
MQVENHGGGYLITGKGQIMSLSKLVPLFGEVVVRSAVITGQLQLDGFSYPDDYEEIISAMGGQNWDSYAVERDCLTGWLATKQGREGRLDILVNELACQRETLEKIYGAVAFLTAEVARLRHRTDPIKTRSSIKEVAEAFPQYKVNSIRNMVGKHKHFDSELGMYVSVLKIEEFEIEFRKNKNSRSWHASRVELQRQISKTYNYGFSNRVAEHKYQRGH